MCFEVICTRLRSDSAVGMAIGYVLDRGSNTGGGRDFPQPSRPVLQFA